MVPIAWLDAAEPGLLTQKQGWVITPEKARVRAIGSGLWTGKEVGVPNEAETCRGCGLWGVL